MFQGPILLEAADRRGALCYHIEDLEQNKQKSSFWHVTNNMKITVVHATRSCIFSRYANVVY